MIPSSCFYIEEIEPHHLDEIIAIEQVSFPTPWPRQVFDMELKSSRSYKRVSKINGTVVGYIIAWKIYDEVHILNLAVHPEHRRRGIGRGLLNDCLLYFSNKGIKSAILEVRVRNKNAIKLYEKTGFRSVGFRRKYYSDTGEDALVMKLDMGYSGKPLESGRTKV
ncbi:MAG TPA: ribosomal protein S18-alanine N-acetyltransferase [Thermodesulfobacteriota bacterium]